jgi:CRISPR-associated protein Cmr4
MSDKLKRHLLTLYTRTPLHVGSGTSVDVVDLPIMRERITGFPLIPASSLKGVLLQHARETFENGTHARSSKDIPEAAKLLFGTIEGAGEDQKSNAGCVQIMEAKILAFPVRSLAGCFAWLTCPAALERFQRDTGLLQHADGKALPIPQPANDKVMAGAELVVGTQVVLEEYALELERPLSPADTERKLIEKLSSLTSDPLWSGKLASRLAIVHDENFQHFVTTCTEVIARIAINPATRTVKGSGGEGGGALFNQENVPCEALFYSVLTVLPSRRTVLGDDSASGSECAGDVIFIGGFPLTPPKLGLDIVNPHHDAHGHDVDPKPNTFLCVEPDSLWRFVFFVRPGSPDAAALLAQTRIWIEEVLTQNGIGAKTAASYGRFRKPTEADRAAQRQADAQAAIAQAAAAKQAEAETQKARLHDAAQAALQADYPNLAIFKNLVLDKLTSPLLEQLRSQIPLLQKAENASWQEKLKQTLATRDCREIRKRLRDKDWFPKEWLPPQ